MKKYLIILIVVISVSCKSNREKTVTTVTTEKNNEVRLNIDCLQKDDKELIDSFEKELKKAIKENNKELIEQHINFPFKSEGIIYTKEEFFLSYLEILRNYYFKEYIDFEEVSDLKRENYFAEKKGLSNCFIYIVSNDFPSYEFSVIFYLEKINNEIKIVEILMAG